MSELVRAFVALPLPPALLRATLEAQAAVRGRASGSKLRPRFVKQEQLHVTLKFLGDVDQEQVAEMSAAVTEAAADCSCLRSRLVGMTAFSSPARARVVVAELSDEAGRLGELAARIEQAAVGLGVEADNRRFRAHVTVARIKRPGNVSGWLQVPVEQAAPTAFEELVLFRSVLGREGPTYTRLARGALPAEDSAP